MQAVTAKLNREQGRPRWTDHRGMGNAYGIEDRGERMELVQFPPISFQIVAVEHEGYISEFVLVARDRARDRLAEFGQDDVI